MKLFLINILFISIILSNEEVALQLPKYNFIL